MIENEGINKHVYCNLARKYLIKSIFFNLLFRDCAQSQSPLLSPLYKYNKIKKI